MRQNWCNDDRMLFYMQMVIPSIFSVDTHGWCASSSVWPLAIKETPINKAIFSKVAQRVENNVSKIVQPPLSSNITLPRKYIFFPCQIPHDETIKYHSDISVAKALAALLHWVACRSDLHLVIKGHPANPSSMLEIKILVDKFKESQKLSIRQRIHWIDALSIHQLINHSDAVFTVNSGVGLESLIHKKRVFAFGNADYSSASEKIIFGGSISNAIENLEFSYSKAYDSDEHDSRCENFIATWYLHHYDTESKQTFAKIDQFF